MIPLEVTMTVAAGGPIFCFVVSMKSLMTLVKSVDDGLRVRESETQLNLNRPLKVSADPMHLSRPLAAETAKITCLPVAVALCPY